MAIPRICSVDACDKPVLARGWCNAHYLLWHRNGSPLARKRSKNGKAMTFIQGVITRCESDECIDWPFARFGTGYGRAKRSGRAIVASRLVCEIVHGKPASPSLEAAHSCGRIICVNPHHLSWKTRAENEADKKIHGTFHTNLNMRIKSTPRKLTADDVRTIRSLEGSYTVREIARRFGLHHSTVHDIQKRERWRWLE